MSELVGWACAREAIRKQSYPAVIPKKGRTYRVRCGKGDLRMKVATIVDGVVIGLITEKRPGVMVRPGKVLGTLNVGDPFSVRIANAVFTIR